MLSQQSERYRRVCISLEDSKRDAHAEHTCIFDAAMRRADARAALAPEDHISTTLDAETYAASRNLGHHVWAGARSGCRRGGLPQKQDGQTHFGRCKRASVTAFVSRDRAPHPPYSTVTDFARFLGLSISAPLMHAA